MSVVKLDSAGSIDTGFGIAGFATIVGGGVGLDESIAGAIALDTSGNIFVGGVSYSALPVGVADVAMLTSKGDLDASFGGSGVVQIDADATYSGSHASQILSLAFDASGNIVAAGTTSEGFSYSMSFVTRLLPKGDLDKSFNGGIPLRNQIDVDVQGKAASVMVDGRGRIIVTGVTQNHAAANHMYAYRFNDDGTPDTTFGSASGYRVLTDEVSPSGGRSALAHGGEIAIFGNMADGSAIVVDELINYDLPPVIPPSHFFTRVEPTRAPSFRPAVQFP